MEVEMISRPPGFVGDTQRVEIRGPQVRATIDVHSDTPQIAGWSAVAVLRNIVSPIVF
jgi:aspartate dehydrogenase